MGKLRKTLKWGFLSILLLAVVLTAAWATSRAMYPTEAQRVAIAEMSQQPGAAGNNAFALLWTLDRDVPDHRLEAVMTEDARRFSEKPGRSNPEAGEPRETASAAEQYPDLAPTDTDRRLFCFAGSEDCLAKVREDLDAHVALIDRNQQLLDRIDGLHDHDYVQFELSHRMNRAIPGYRYAAFPRTRHAVEFAQGQKQEAVAATCREIATWRRLSASSDNLITQQIGISIATDQNGYTLANMLTELPVGAPLPEPCDEALAPPSIDEVSICKAMRGEFAVSAETTKNLAKRVDQDSYFDRLASTVLFDAESTLGMKAERIQSVCDETERDSLRADSPDLSESSPAGLARFACIGNPAGCMLNSIESQGDSDYRRRLQDHGSRLRVLATLAWMRRHADDSDSPRDLLDARPAELASPAREITFGPEGRTLRVPVYDTTHSDAWSIPLPPSLYAVVNE